MNPPQKLSFFEKTGYSCADAAANFVFMTMILFQLNFYTDTFGLTASAAAAILLWPRLWDAIFDPIMGVLADRTKTRWGRFRPWILWTAVPWAVVMVLAYTTPQGWSMGALIAYAGITNTLLMTLYSMNNMPYSALGGVITADLNERAKLNSFRFIAVNIAQFIVGGFTLPLVAKFAAGNGEVLREKYYDGPRLQTELLAPRGLAMRDGMIVLAGTSAGDPPDHHEELDGTGGEMLPGTLARHVVHYEMATVVFWEKVPPLSMALVPTGVRLRFAGRPDTTYQVQRATVLTGPWETIASITAPSEGLTEYLDNTPPAGMSFYRVAAP